MGNNDLIKRSIEGAIKAQIGKYSVITITGPRQSGKTTLIKTIFEDLPYYSLEDPETYEEIRKDPRALFQKCNNKVILDEVQRLPILLSYIQGIVDNDRESLFVLSGSHNMLMMESVSQTLAGRTAIFYLQPLSYAELINHLPFETLPFELIWKGGYARIYDRDIDPERFYRSYIATYVERDVRQVKNIGNLTSFNRFLAVCAGFIGQTLNKNTLADATGITRLTVDSWLSVLETSFIIYPVQPYYKNFKKRLIKSPKLYFRDTGLACALLNIRSPDTLSNYYQRGAVFENFIINEVAKGYYNRGLHPPLYFWRDSNQHEIDLLLDHGDSLQPIEIKSGATFRREYFKQLDWFAGVADVPLSNPTVIYGGDEPWEMASGKLMSWRQVDDLVQ